MKLIQLFIISALIISCNGKKESILERENIEIKIPQGMFNSIKSKSRYVLSEIYTKSTPKPLTTFEIESYDGFEDIEDFSKHYEEEILKPLGKTTILSKKDTLFYNKKAKFYEGEISLQNWQFKFRTIFFIKKSKIIKLSHVSKKDEFESQKELTTPLFEQFKN
tara:strand:- start:152 stop:643 length:492 start_codon:yes stop_codon:yes gene_type:complete